MLSTIGSAMTKLTDLPTLALWFLVLVADIAALVAVWVLVDSFLLPIL